MHISSATLSFLPGQLKSGLVTPVLPAAFASAAGLRIASSWLIWGFLMFAASVIMAQGSSSMVEVHKGSYYGLLRPVSAANTNNTSVGLLLGTLASSSRVFTGQICLDGKKTSFIGTFTNDGQLAFKKGANISASLQMGIRDLSLSYQDNGQSGTIAVSLYEEGTLLSYGEADRAYYSSTSKIPRELLSRTMQSLSPTRGAFNVALLSRKIQVPTRDVSSYPQGDGYGIITLVSSGTLTFAGVLSDGRAFTAGSGMVSSSAFPFYAYVAAPGVSTSVKGGSFSGEMIINTEATDSDVTGPDLLWLRPEVEQKVSMNLSALASQLYTSGWPSGIRVDAVGTFYDKGETIQQCLGMGATDKARLEFGSNKINNVNHGITVDAFSIIDNSVTKHSRSDPRFALSVKASTGLFGGNFTPNWVCNKLPVFKGILLQKGTSRAGYGFFISNVVDDLDPESGKVRLSRVP